MSVGFVSGLGPDLTAFLSFKRALGHPYLRAEFTLRAFDKAFAKRKLGSARLDQAMLAWLGRSASRKAVSVACELAVLRQFHEFLRRQGRAFREPSWPKLPTTSDHRPRVFSKAEVRLLLRLTVKLGAPFRARLFRTLLLVLYCTGLRIGEAVRLALCDVDIARGTLFVGLSKGRARWVPCHRSLCRELNGYLAARSRLAFVRPGAGFFVDSNGNPLSVRRASLAVVRLLRLAGLKPALGRQGPRPYDLRHTFAVHRLTHWYRAGVDLHTRLPWLSAYMGHEDLSGTETYLHATPELLALASSRFGERLRGTRGSP